MAKPLKSQELRQMSDEQLHLTLKETIKHLFQLRLQRETEGIKAPAELRKARRHIARIKTIMRQREIKPQRSGPAALSR